MIIFVSIFVSLLFFVILYNMIESVTTNLLIEIYDTLDKKSISYNEIATNIKECWLKVNKHSYSNAIPKRIDNVKHIEDILKIIANPLEFFNRDDNSNEDDFVVQLKRSFNLNGTINVGSLKEFSKKHGIILDLPDNNGHSRTLQEIKSNRNYLAHGEKSFNDVGKSYQLQDLEKCKQNVVELLEQFIEQVGQYMYDQQYLEKD
jgi:hypothetical protein